MASEFYKKIRVNVPNRSGEDLSFQHLLTAKCGTLVPIFWDELMPGRKVFLKDAISASLPPLASDTFMRCKLKLEAFFVPHRQLSGSFVPWLTGDKVFDPQGNVEITPTIPLAKIPASAVSTYHGPGTLSDYLGFKINRFASGAPDYYVNIFPYLAYHWIWDNMYRNSKIQKRAFSVPAYGSAVSASSYRAAYIPYVNMNAQEVGLYTSVSSCLADGKYLYELRQRNFDCDYFTSCTLNPQSTANPAAVTFQVDSQGNGQFTIAALRAQNSLQQYLERQNIGGPRYVEWLKANYGVNLEEGIAQIPLFLGRQVIDVYSKGVESTANVAGSTNNPFAGSTGARYGSAYALGSNVLVDNFEAKESGILMVMASLVPKVTYATGVDPMMLHFRSQSSQGDVPSPILQNVGQQPVYQEQLTGDLATNLVFGYTDRYAEFMAKVDRVSGLLRDGQSLQSFALQRSFGTPPTLGSSFLEIPTSYLDQVSAVTGDISNYGVWIDSYFEYKVSQPLAQYSMPSLQDPAYEHGHGVWISRSGQIVN